MPSQRHLPEQGRDPAQPPDPLSVGTRKPLAPKCQIVVELLYKKQNKKKVVTCHSNRTGIHYTQEIHAHGQISKFTSFRIGEAEPSAHPHPPVENSLHSPQHLWAPSVSLQRQSGKVGSRQEARNHVATSSEWPGLPQPNLQSSGHQRESRQSLGTAADLL